MSGEQVVHDPYDDEIDLFDLFETIWEGKWKVLLTTLVAALTGILILFLQPSSYSGRMLLSPAKENVFSAYAALNLQLVDSGLARIDDAQACIGCIDSETVFEAFVLEFRDGAEARQAVREQSSEFAAFDGSDREKRLRLQELVSNIALSAPSKKETEWYLELEWVNREEGEAIVQTILETVSSNVVNDTKERVLVLSDSLEQVRANKIELLQERIALLSKDIALRYESRLIHLAAQARIARELGLDGGLWDVKGPGKLKLESEDFFLSMQPAPEKMHEYLRGFKAIEKEIEVLQQRPERDRLLVEDEYLALRKEVQEAEADLAGRQLRRTVDQFQKDSGSGWVEYNIDNLYLKSKKRPALVLALSVMLGGLVGVMFVLISKGFRNRRESVALPATGAMSGGQS